jgi:hypothetical protein
MVIHDNSGGIIQTGTFVFWCVASTLAFCLAVLWIGLSGTLLVVLGIILAGVVRWVNLWLWRKQTFVPNNTVLIISKFKKLHRVFGPQRYWMMQTRYVFPIAHMPLGELLIDLPVENVSVSGTHSLKQIHVRVRFVLCREHHMRLMGAPNRMQISKAVADRMGLNVSQARLHTEFWEEVARQVVEQEVIVQLRDAVYCDERWSAVMEQSCKLGGLARGPQGENMYDELCQVLEPRLQETLKGYGIQIKRLHVLMIEPLDVEMVRRIRMEHLEDQEQTEQIKRKVAALIEAFREQGFDQPGMMEQVITNVFHASNLAHYPVIRPSGGILERSTRFAEHENGLRQHGNGTHKKHVKES